MFGANGLPRLALRNLPGRIVDFVFAGFSIGLPLAPTDALRVSCASDLMLSTRGASGDIGITKSVEFDSTLKQLLIATRAIEEPIRYLIRRGNLLVMVLLPGERNRKSSIKHFS